MSKTSTVILMTKYFHDSKELQTPVSCPIAIFTGDNQKERAKSAVEILIAKAYYGVTYETIDGVSTDEV